MTISESKFEAYCAANGIQYSRVNAGTNKTPDYKILLEGHPVVVEVKELTPNDGDIKALRDMEEKGSAVWGTDDFGGRIRKKINDSKRQLQALAAGRCPGLLVLYDARPSFIRGIHPQEVLVAMYGALTVVFRSPDEPGKPYIPAGEKFGKGKKLRHDTHTYISALAVMREQDPSPTLHLDVYHNIYADHPLPLELLLRRSDMTLYTIDASKGDQFRGWLRIVGEK